MPGTCPSPCLAAFTRTRTACRPWPRPWPRCRPAGHGSSTCWAQRPATGLPRSLSNGRRLTTPSPPAGANGCCWTAPRCARTTWAPPNLPPSCRPSAINAFYGIAALPACRKRYKLCSNTRTTSWAGGTPPWWHAPPPSSVPTATTGPVGWPTATKSATTRHGKKRSTPTRSCPGCTRAPASLAAPRTSASTGPSAWSPPMAAGCCRRRPAPTAPSPVAAASTWAIRRRRLGRVNAAAFRMRTACGWCTPTWATAKPGR